MHTSHSLIRMIVKGHPMAGRRMEFTQHPYTAHTPHSAPLLSPTQVFVLFRKTAPTPPSRSLYLIQLAQVVYMYHPTQRIRMMQYPFVRRRWRLLSERPHSLPQLHVHRSVSLLLLIPDNLAYFSITFSLLRATYLLRLLFLCPSWMCPALPFILQRASSLQACI